MRRASVRRGALMLTISALVLIVAGPAPGQADGTGREQISAGVGDAVRFRDRSRQGSPPVWPPLPFDSNHIPADLPLLCTSGATTMDRPFGRQYVRAKRRGFGGAIETLGSGGQGPVSYFAFVGRLGPAGSATGTVEYEGAESFTDGVASGHCETGPLTWSAQASEASAAAD